MLKACKDPFRIRVRRLQGVWIWLMTRLMGSFFPTATMPKWKWDEQIAAAACARKRMRGHFEETWWHFDRLRKCGLVYDSPWYGIAWRALWGAYFSSAATTLHCIISNWRTFCKPKNENQNYYERLSILPLRFMLQKYSILYNFNVWCGYRHIGLVLCYTTDVRTIRRTCVKYNFTQKSDNPTN